MSEQTAVLVSGAFRSYPKALGPFLDQLPDSFDIFLCCPNYASQDQYLNDAISVDNLLKNPRIKCILCLEDPEILSSRLLSDRERNTYLQWYRLYKLFQEVDSTKYKTVLRMRPDMNLQCNSLTFVSTLQHLHPLQKQTLYIPNGFDIFHSKFQHSASINDQFAYGTLDSMQIYCGMYEYLQEQITLPSCIVSEELLHSHIQKNNLIIQRIDIPYTLLLSQCFTISICGDSASGKSSLAKLIHETLPFDKTLLFETDRYHKWERGAEEYRRYTHLHPEANHLEKLSTDAYSLRLGQDVYTVDYDHDTGKFTEPQCVQPKQFTVFCGLHTLYLDSLRDIMDLKIYMDTDPKLKEYWKIQRDTADRSASEEKIRSTMAMRQPDFIQYVEPQKKNADIWIRFSNPTPENEDTLQLTINVKESMVTQDLLTKLSPFCLNQIKDALASVPVYVLECDKFASANQLTEAAVMEGYSITRLKDSFRGILQYLFILLTWKPSIKTILHSTD